MRHFLDFEKPIASLEGKVEELRHMSTDGSINIADEIGKLQTRIERELKQTYETLGAWEKVQVARHPERPKVSDIFERLLTDFTPLAGDRNYAEDHAVIAGMARFRGQSVMVIGTEKGCTTEERVKRNFGMARPVLVQAIKGCKPKALVKALTNGAWFAMCHLAYSVARLLVFLVQTVPVRQQPFTCLPDYCPPMRDRFLLMGAMSPACPFSSARVLAWDICHRNLASFAA